jgi:RNA-splicing ligase RtcB
MSFSRNLKKHTIPSPCFEFHVVFSHEIHIPQPMASRRGLPQLGTLGAGNHYAEIQVKMEGMGLG